MGALVEETLEGTGPAPLAAVTRYRFRLAPGEIANAPWALHIPYVQRGSWDDYGVAELPEQASFVWRLLRALEVPMPVSYPGEWPLPDEATAERVWRALRAKLEAPHGEAPACSMGRELSAQEARAAQESLTARYLALASVVLGLDTSWERTHHEVHVGDYEARRSERWKNGEVLAELSGEGACTGYGVQGETVTLTLSQLHRGGRGVDVTAALNMRTGGQVDVTITGVVNVQALAARFLAGEAIVTAP
ncbi:MAG: hypothetical protein HY909_31520 [Deltaproteobacteria bacterium]|nr:hypothetical protein [Deltaproteobacteria bacterium]